MRLGIASGFGLLMWLATSVYAANPDIDQTAEPALAFQQKLIIPLPLLPGPVTIHHNQRRSFWLQVIHRSAQKQTWHAPALTPAAAAAALALAEQKRKANLARRMADRAFYFGYDTNKDALK